MLSEIRCVLVDDESKSLELLRKRLGLLFPNMVVEGAFTGWEDAAMHLNTKGTDLLFLDISMPEKNGIDFLKLFPNRKFDVIYTTAHAQYAIDAIKLSAIGYVLKPINDEELVFAVNKFLDKHNGKSASESVSHSKIGIPNAGGVDYIAQDDILYLESINKYTKVITKEYSIVSSYNIGKFKTMVDEKHFFQTHRSYIINLDKVKRYSPPCIIMEDDKEVPLSKSAKEMFLKKFDIISGGKG